MTPTIALPTLYRNAVAMLTAGNPPEAVLDALVKKGLLEPYARVLIANAGRESGILTAA